MKRLIASDVHGSARFCRQLVQLYHQEGAQQLVLLGDLAYSGSYDPSYEYDPLEVIRQLNALAGEIVWVEGNCDYGVAALRPRFARHPDYLIQDWEGTGPTIRRPGAVPSCCSPGTPMCRPGAGWRICSAPIPARSPCPGAARRTAACSMRTASSAGSP